MIEVKKKMQIRFFFCKSDFCSNRPKSMSMSTMSMSAEGGYRQPPTRHQIECHAQCALTMWWLRVVIKVNYSPHILEDRGGCQGGSAEGSYRQPPTRHQVGCHTQCALTMWWLRVVIKVFLWQSQAIWMTLYTYLGGWLYGPKAPRNRFCIFIFGSKWSPWNTLNCSWTLSDVIRTYDTK